MRTIRRHGTPVPDSERGSTKSFQDDSEEPTTVLGTFKSAFKKANRESTRPVMNISAPMRDNNGQ
jgi:hypothetical protein